MPVSRSESSGPHRFRTRESNRQKPPRALESTRSPKAPSASAARASPPHAAYRASPLLLPRLLGRLLVRIMVLGRNLSSNRLEHAFGRFRVRAVRFELKILLQRLHGTRGRDYLPVRRGGRLRNQTERILILGRGVVRIRIDCFFEHIGGLI